VSVVANVAINVDSRGAVSKLRQVQQGAQATQRATTDLTTAFSKLQAGATNAFSKLQAGATTAFSKLQAGATNAAKSLSGLRGVLASIGATAAVSKAFGDAQALMLAQKRLSRLTQEYKQFAGAQQEAERLANKFEVSVTDTAGALGSLASRLGAQGRSLNDIVAVYEGLNSALVATGRSSTEAAAASYQLSQALGSGSLTGDELKTISETLPELLNEVAKAAGVSSLQIRELAKDGKLSADLIIQATKQLRDKYSQDVEANITATQKFQNALSGLSEAVGTELAPAITELLKAGAEALKLFGKLPGPMKTIIAAAIGLTAAFVALAPAISTVIGLLTAAQLAALVAAGPWIALAAGITAAAVALASYRTESEKIGAKAAAGDPAAMSAARGRMVTLEQEIALMKLEGAEKASPRSALGGSFANAKAEFARLKRDVTTGQTAAATPTPTPTPTPTTGTGTGKGAGKGKDDAARIAEQMQQQLKAANDINFALKNRLAIAQTTEPVAKRMLEYDVKQNEIAKEYDELKKVAKSADELALINANLVIEQRIAQVEYEREINELLIERATLVANLVKASSMPTVYNELEEQDAALQAILDKYPAIGSAADAAATLATSGIAAMIDGTKSAEQVFVEFLSSIADALIDTAKQMIAQYIAIGIARMFAGVGAPGGFAPSGPLAAVGNVNTDVSGFFSPSANGNAFGANGIIPFAKGGIVNSPTLFPFAKGIGLMGEAGPEAILPLSRGPGGKLGVMASGGGGDVNVVVNVDAKGTSVEGKEPDANQLGRVISAAVQSELIKQQRPGGILAR
jgi:tape measure domain-containing protein